MQFIFALILLFNVAFISGEKCDPKTCENYLFEEHYRDLQCEPVYSDDDSCCPKRYNCPIIQKAQESKNKCHYHGQVLEIGSSLQDYQGDKCHACYCSQSPQSEFAYFICAAAYCGPNKYNEGNCRLKFDLKKCCPEVICDDNPSLVKKCLVEGKEYKAGQFFNLESDKCKRCVCDEDGKAQCENRGCNIEIDGFRYITNYCAPEYQGTTRCCPSNYICSEDDIKSIVYKHIGSHTDPENQCKFGTYLLQIGDELLVGKRRCLSCKCTTPPLVTCIQDMKCTP